MKTLESFFRKNKILHLCLCVSFLAITSCKKTGESGNSNPNQPVNQTKLSVELKGHHSTSFDNGWITSVSAVSDTSGGSITITCKTSPTPVSGRIYYEVLVNNSLYAFYGNSIFIDTKPSTTYSISVTAYYYTSIGETAVATANTSVTTKAGSGVVRNPGCPGYASLALFPLDTSTIANESGWTYIQYDWVVPPGTTSQNPGMTQLRYRETGSNTWLYGPVSTFNSGGTDLNHRFIINLIPGQSYQVQLGTDCHTGVIPVEADFDKNQIYSITAGPM